MTETNDPHLPSLDTVTLRHRCVTETVKSGRKAQHRTAQLQIRFNHYMIVKNFSFFCLCPFLKNPSSTETMFSYFHFYTTV